MPSPLPRPLSVRGARCRLALGASVSIGLLALPAASAEPADPHAVARALPARVGTAPGSEPNGVGYMRMRLAPTSDGRVRVSWVRPGRVKQLRKYVVRVGANRSLDVQTHAYAVGRARQSVIVPRAYGATPATGNSTFVKLTVHRRNGTTGSTTTKWVQTPPGAACTAAAEDRVTVGTFNVRSWAADARNGTRLTWTTRGPNVVTEILRSGARVVAVQEASGRGGTGFGPLDQKDWILAQLNQRDPGGRARWVDAMSDEEYRSHGYTRGLVGTRIFYDASRFDELDSGLALITDRVAATALVPWVRLQQVGGGQSPFVMTSNHLDVGEARSDYDNRGRQAAKLVTIIGALKERFGDQVVVAGDMNSTLNTKPYNNVLDALYKAGAYDSFATTGRAVNAQYGTTNNFQLPPRATPNRRDYILTVGPLRGSCGYANLVYAQVSRIASDHFMQVATLPLPRVVR